MNAIISALFTRYHDWKGQVVAYGGGTSVSVFSNEVAAKATKAAEAAATAPDITVANLISAGGLLIITCRLIFDIYVHFDKKRQQKES